MVITLSFANLLLKLHTYTKQILLSLCHYIVDSKLTRKKKKPKDPIERDIERELCSVFQRKGGREIERERGSRFWSRQPLVEPTTAVYGFRFLFFYMKVPCVGWSSLCRSKFIYLLFFFSHHFSFIFSIMIYGGGHKNFWLMSMVV